MSEMWSAILCNINVLTLRRILDITVSIAQHFVLLLYMTVGLVCEACTTVHWNSREVR